MSQYELSDFTESLIAAGVGRDDIKRVVKAHGSQGAWAEWSGGFLVELNTGQFAYVWGWCDTTGWGCQDGGGVEHFTTAPSDDEIQERTGEQGAFQWDDEPADLNRYIRHEIEDRYGPGGSS